MRMSWKNWNSGQRIMIIILAVWVGCFLLDFIHEYWISIWSYHYDDVDALRAFVPPFSEGENGLHLLGTDRVGHDVFAGMIHGGRIAFQIVFFSLFISYFIGAFVGVNTAYYGNRRIKQNILQIIILVLTTIATFYYLFDLIARTWTLFSFVLMIISPIIGYILLKAADKLRFKKYPLPLDNLLLRVFEIRESIPALILILAIISIIQNPSWFSLILTLIALYWITFARHFRAETMNIKDNGYVKASEVLQLPHYIIKYKHILINVMPPVFVIAAFSAGSIILLESTLSFLGIGIPVEEVTWGVLLSEARSVPKAWWLAVFPGLAIFLVIYALLNLGNYLSQLHRKNS